MIAIILALIRLPAPITFEADLARALHGRSLSGTAFHRTVLTTMKRHGKVVTPPTSASTYVQHTRGNTKGRILWCSDQREYFSHEMYLIWRVGKRVRVQLLPEPHGGDGAWGVYRPGYLSGKELTFADAAWAGGNWTRPCVRLYQVRNGKWQLAQALYSDEETSQTPNFAIRNGRTNLATINAQVRVFPKHLSQPHAGPMLLYSIQFQRVGSRYRLVRRQPVPTPLATLDTLAGLYDKGKRRTFNRQVPAPLRGKLWEALGGSPRVTSNDDSEDSTILSVAGLAVGFKRVGRYWRPAWTKPERRGS